MNKFIYWTPRVLSILFICFLALFSFDVITPEAKWWEIAVGLFMHNIPVFILIAVLVIAWKREIVGGIAFILAGLLYIGLLLSGALKGGFEWYMLSWMLFIAGPAFLVGVLWLVNWRHRKRALRAAPAQPSLPATK